MKAFITIAATILLTALCIKAAYITRGYFAVGGEWFLWVYPALWFAVRCCEKGKEKAPTERQFR